MKQSIQLTTDQQILVLENIPLIYYTSQKYRHIPTVAYEDLTSRLYYRLCAAVSQYDPTRGFEISTYLVASLQGEMKNYFRDEVWAVKPPRPQREKFFSDGTEVDGVSARIQSCATPVSLDSYIDCGDSEFRADVVASDDCVEDHVVNFVGGRDILRLLFSLLKPEERLILALRMRGKPVSEIQSRFRVSRSVASKVWEELRDKARTLYIGIINGDEVCASRGSRILSKALASKFVPPKVGFIDLRLMISSGDYRVHS